MNIQSKVPLHIGINIPLVGLGTWKLKGDVALQRVYDALELGYRLIDTSGDYGNHHEVGEAIRNSSVPRKDIFLVTKVEEDEDAYEATKSDLAELGMDYADLMLIHRPPESGAGKELWKGLARAKRDGLAREIGVSNYSIPNIEEIANTTGEKPVVNQIEWSPFGYSRDMLAFCRREGITIMAYSPLTRATRLDEEALEDMAQKYGKTSAQLLIRWNIQHGVVSIPKAAHRDHLAENIDVFTFAISREDMEILDSLNEHYSALGSLPYVSSRGVEEQ